MPDVCSEQGCQGRVFARGLCSKHYQRRRRAGFAQEAPAGRPREYPRELADPHGGAPKLTVRLEPEVLEWVRQQGGATWVRHVARKLKRLSDDPGFQDWWEELALPEDDG